MVEEAGYRVLFVSFSERRVSHHDGCDFAVTIKQDEKYLLTASASRRGWSGGDKLTKLVETCFLWSTDDDPQL